MILKFLRRWLGLDADMEFLTRKLNHQADGFSQMFEEQSQDIRMLADRAADLSRNVRVQNDGLGRIIAKLDPMYGRPEAPPILTEYKSKEEAQKAQEDWAARKADSDRLGEQALNRLYTEHDARERTLPKGLQGKF